MDLKVFVYGKEDEPAVGGAIKLLAKKNVTRVDDPAAADVAIAPMLRKFITMEEIEAPRYGTLVFHPSLLPRHRGRDAIAWALEFEEPYTGATWFWADEGVDAGPICEQEVLVIKPGIHPIDFYIKKVLPSCLRMLGYILDDLEMGYVRRRPQNEKDAQHEPRFTEEAAAEARAARDAEIEKGRAKKTTNQRQENDQ